MKVLQSDGGTGRWAEWNGMKEPNKEIERDNLRTDNIDKTESVRKICSHGSQHTCAGSIYSRPLSV